MLGGLPLELLLSPWALAILGLAVGSFLNVVVHRLPAMLERQWWGDVAAQLADSDAYRRTFGVAPTEDLLLSGKALQQRMEALPALTLSRPASRCPSCGHAIRWHENIPVLGWLRLRGRCSACGSGISPRYPLTEALTAALFAGVAWRIGPQPVALLWCAFVAILVALSSIDWDTTVLPDALTLPLLWGGLAASALGLGLTPQASIIGAVVGYLALWSVYWLFKLTTGKEGMGYGDFKLLAAMGAWLGWQAILPIVLMASVIGAAVGLLMKVGGALREGRYVPFGPFLAGGGLVVLLLGLPAILEFMGWS